MRSRFRSFRGFACIHRDAGSHSGTFDALSDAHNTGSECPYFG